MGHAASTHTQKHTLVFHFLFSAHKHTVPARAHTQAAPNFLPWTIVTGVELPPWTFYPRVKMTDTHWRSSSLRCLRPRSRSQLPSLTAEEVTRLIMRGKWKSLQEGLILTGTGRRVLRATCGIKGGLTGHLSGANKQAESRESFQFNQATLSVCMFEEGKKKEEKNKLILQQP